MKILITGGAGKLARAIAAELGGEHELCFMDGNILDAEDVRQAVQGIDALIHTGDPPPDHAAGWLALNRRYSIWRPEERTISSRRLFPQELTG